MAQEGFKRKLTAILSADVVGYSRLMGEDEDTTVQTLTTYRDVISSLIKDHNGRVVDSPGDNILAEFGSVVNSLRCAWDVQQEIKSRNADLPENRRMNFRIGINLGDVIEEEDRIYGDGVNIAARLEGLAEEGGICISGTAYDLVKNKLPFRYENQGEQIVKNIKGPVRVYKVLIEKDADELILGKKLELSEKPSIAVLPFVNMTGDPDQEYFSDGITEEIITGLSKVPHLFVIARNSTFTYKGKPVKVQQVGQELGVLNVLEGSVRKARDQVRITAQLIDAKTGHHLWADRYDRKLKDIFAIQDEVTMKVISALQVKLTEGDHARLFVKGTKNLEAYLKLLEGRKHFFSLNKDSNFLAQQMAKEVVALDPEYPRAYQLLGWTHIFDVLFGASKSPNESLSSSEELARKALELDDSLARPHALLGYTYMMKKQWDKALAEGERAVSMAPNSENFYILGQILTFVGRPEESVTLHKKGMRLDPISPGAAFGQLGLAYLMAGRYEEAISACKKAIHSEPDFLAAHNYLAASYSLAGREEKARAEVAEVFRIDPKFSLERFVKTRSFKNQTDTDLFINALRKAGLK